MAANEVDDVDPRQQILDKTGRDQRPDTPAAGAGAASRALTCPETTPMSARLEQRHDLADQLRAACAAGRTCDCLADRSADRGVDLGGAELLRQVAGKDRKLGLLLVDQIGARCRGELGDRFAPLLDQLFDDRDHRGIVEHDPLVDLALLDRGQQHPNSRQWQRLTGAHRGFHVVGDPLLQRYQRDGHRIIETWRKRRRPPSVHLLGQHLAAQPLEVTLDRGRFLALALGGGLFVELARAQLGQQSAFLDRALEAAQRYLEGLVFLDANGRHLIITSVALSSKL